MAAEDGVRRQAQRAKGRLPGCPGRWDLDVLEDLAERACEEVVLVPNVVVERHRLDPESTGEPPHRERDETLGIGELDGCREDPIPGQRFAVLDNLTAYVYSPAHPLQRKTRSALMQPGSTSPPDRPEIPETMLAAVHDRYGGPDVIEVREVPTPVPGPGQVLVRVRAASLNQVDQYLLRGTPFLARMSGGFRRPKDPGMGSDFAGEVVAVGSDVTDVEPGDPVLGSSVRTFAEYAVVKAEGVVGKPTNVSWEQAACVGVAALTALQGLRRHGRLEPGQRVLVTGAGGGVGGFAVRIAKALGADVTATTRAWNLERVRTMGADRVFETAGRGDPAVDALAVPDAYDLVVDVAGDRSLRALARATRPGGRVVLVGKWRMTMPTLVAWQVGARLLSRTSGRRVFWFYAERTREDLTTLAGLLASGAIVADIERTYPLAGVADAMRHLETWQTRGKIVLAMESVATGRG